MKKDVSRHEDVERQTWKHIDTPSFLAFYCGLSSVRFRITVFISNFMSVRFCGEIKHKLTTLRVLIPVQGHKIVHFAQMKISHQTLKQRRNNRGVEIVAQGQRHRDRRRDIDVETEMWRQKRRDRDIDREVEKDVEIAIRDRDKETEMKRQKRRDKVGKTEP